MRTSRSTTSTSTTCRPTATNGCSTSTRRPTFPYGDLVGTNRHRSRHEMEYELVDTGIFDEGRYFDVEVEHAKVAPEDILCRITVHNRSADDAPIHVLPTLWFRNTWDWAPNDPKPRIARVDGPLPIVRTEHHSLPPMYLYAEAGADLLFCENETNTRRLWNVDGTTGVPQRRHRRPPHPRRPHRQPRRRGYEGGGPRPPRGAGRGAGDHAGTAHHRWARGARRAVRRCRRRDRHGAGPKPTSSTTPSHPRRSTLMPRT